uniref:Laccase n=1 Tax=Amphimedon queenslandica TaxID=400682 RepID=A0A1X7TUL5_AMPQE
MIRLLMLLEVFCLFILIAYQQVIAEVVICNHNTPVCECTTASDEACEFTLDIEMLQTFTRYLLDNTGDSRGTAGSVWHINNGEWEPVDYNTLCGSSIDSAKCTQPFGVDGYTFRSFIAVNGRIPGPTLIVTEGQLVKVTVMNRLASESVSVHWHGMHQRNSNWMDGVEHVTQCGIPPGASFTYIFKAEQYGTHWYHSHSGAQRTDGLFGALIVKERSNTQRNNLLSKLTDFDITGYNDYPAQHTLTLLDWQKSSSLDLFTQIHSGIMYFDIDKASELQGNEATGTTSSDGADIGPVRYWSGLINGRGKHNGINYINSRLSEFNVIAGNTYRFRLIGAQSLYAYRFSIEGHKLIVIATDGQFIEPVIVDYIIIHSGERYDFLLKTKSETDLVSTQQFMIRAVTLNFTETSNYETEQSAEAILSYSGDDTLSSQYESIAKTSQTVRDRCTDDDNCIALNCPFKNFPDEFHINCTHIDQLKLLTDYPTNELPTIVTNQNSDSRKFFNFGFEGTRRTSTINGRINDCDRDNKDEVISPKCYCTHVVEVEADRSIELVISATGPNYNDVNPESSNFLFAHPVHLHGHYFHVVDIQFGEYDSNGKLRAGNSDINCGGRDLCTNPSWKPGKDYSTRKEMTGRVSSKAPLKDTLLIPAGGYAVVYFKTDNPGWWFLHCHIEVHQLEGMGVIINEKGFKTPPPEGMYKCGKYSLGLDEFKAASAVTASPTPTSSSTPPTSGGMESGRGKYFTGYIIATAIISVLLAVQL